MGEHRKGLSSMANNGRKFKIVSRGVSRETMGLIQDSNKGW